MEKLPEGYVPLLNHGFCGLVQSCGSDDFVVRAARVSYGESTKTAAEDRNTLRYMLNHRHGTPFEHNSLTFHCKMPVFVARQWIRHRIGVSFNEISGRYAEMKDEFFMMDVSSLRKQSMTNKQGSSNEPLSPEEAETLLAQIEATYATEYATYRAQLDAGVAKELARAVLPLALYTEWYFTCNLRSLFAFCLLRSDSHAQEEIRIYSDAMLDMAEPLFPISVQAFKDYQLNAMSFSVMEQKLLSVIVEEGLKSNVGQEAYVIEALHLGMSKRETAEFKAKLAKLTSYT